MTVSLASQETVTSVDTLFFKYFYPDIKTAITINYLLEAVELLLVHLQASAQSLSVDSLGNSPPSTSALSSTLWLFKLLSDSLRLKKEKYAHKRHRNSKLENIRK